jgi:hypothetical protein
MLMSGCWFGGQTTAPQTAAIEVRLTTTPSDPAVSLTAYVFDMVSGNRATAQVSEGRSASFTNLGAGFTIDVGVQNLSSYNCEIAGSPSSYSVQTVADSTIIVDFTVHCRPSSIRVVVSGLPTGQRVDFFSDYGPKHRSPAFGVYGDPISAAANTALANGIHDFPAYPDRYTITAAAFTDISSPAVSYHWFLQPAVVSTTTGDTVVINAAFQPLQQCPSNALQAWYRMNGSGADTSGYARGGQLRGPVPVADRYGTPGAALGFDGIDDLIDIGLPLFGSLGVPFSVALWAYQPAAARGDWRSIFATDDGLGVYAGVWLQVSPTGELQVSLGDGGPVGPGSRRTVDSKTAIPTDRWTHLAATVRGPTDMTLYVDGTAVGGTYSGAGGPLAHTNAPARIGAFSLIAANRPWLGRLDELRVYSCSLSAAEVAVLHAQP